MPPQRKGWRSPSVVNLVPSWQSICLWITLCSQSVHIQYGAVIASKDFLYGLNALPLCDQSPCIGFNRFLDQRNGAHFQILFEGRNCHTL